MIDQALTLCSPAGCFSHVCLHGRFVDGSQSFQMAGDKGLTSAHPYAALVGNILALLLKGLQVFLCDSPSRCRSWPTAERCACGPCSAASSAVGTSFVRSGCAVIRLCTQSVTPVSLPRPGLPCRIGASEPVSRQRRTMSLTNLIKTQIRRAVSVCVKPCSTNHTARLRNSTGCGLPITEPQIYLKGGEPQHRR